MPNLAKYGIVESIAIILAVMGIIWIEPATNGGVAVIIVIVILFVNVIFAILKKIFNW